jgi:Mlc titration factor MtfA (ptsG expression regulator)
MPQDSVPIILHYKDSAFTVYSLEEYNQLPDSLKGSYEQQYYVDSIYNALQYVNAPKVGTEEDNSGESGFSIVMIVVFGIIAFNIYRLIRQLIKEQNDPANAASFESDEGNELEPAVRYLIYKGEELKFSDDEVHIVCKKYNPYYQKLNADKQPVFIERVQEFIHSKDFYICSPKGYKEMPILISASAVQITFGLKDFLLPHFSNIIIHPEEYFAYDPFRILVGNVQGHSISLSWKHFLQDYQNPTDGKNVGLHEMAHALQVQYLFRNPKRSNTFKEDFEHYDRIDDDVLNAEKTNDRRMFDENALRNKNEFWATSVELFFEKPVELKTQYPDLYESLRIVLNQDTAAM